MPDIFLSYSRDDQAVARRFAQAFEHEGLSVWWDQALVAGAAFDEVTEKALEDAAAVVVLWSKKSVTSRWVRAEATQANERDTLVPVMIEPCKRPIMFELTHSVELSHWKGDTSDPAWRTLVTDVRSFVEKAAARGLAPANDAPLKSPTRPSIGGTRVGGPLIAAMCAGLLAVAGGAWWLLTHGATDATTNAAAASGEVSLAVLPFANLSADPDQEYFSDGLTEEIMNELAQVKGLRLIARSSSFAFKGRNEDARVIGEKLGVKNLLEGSIRSKGNIVRVNAQLISAVDGSNQWSKAYEGDMTDVFVLQAQIAKDAARALSVTLDVGDSSRSKGGTTNVDAYFEFLEGQAALATWRVSVFGEAAGHFARAVELDPTFARALVMLVRARSRDAVFEGGPDQRLRVESTLDEAGPMLERALQLAPGLADAYVERGDLNVYTNPQSAEKDYRKAIELAPSDARAHQQLAALLYDDRNRRQEVVELLERAHALDPLDSELDVTRAVFVNYGFGKFREADLILKQVLKRDPKYLPALTRRGEVLAFGLGQPVEAIRVLTQALEVDPKMDFARSAMIQAYLSIGDLHGARALATQSEAAPVHRMLVALAENRVEEAARLAYEAIDAGTVSGIDQWMAVAAIDLDARRHGHYDAAAAALNEVLNIRWVSAEQPVQRDNPGSPSDTVTYASLLRASGDERRSAALLREIDRFLNESIAQAGAVNHWHRVTQARIAALKGKPDEAVQILTQDYRELPGAWSPLDHVSLYEPLRKLPGFQAILSSEETRGAEARKVLRAQPR